MDLDNEFLCSSCRLQNIEVLFFQPWVKDTRLRKIKFGSISEIFEQRGCRLCMLVKHTYQTCFGAEQLATFMKVLSDAKSVPVITAYLNPLDVTFDTTSVSAAGMAMSVDLHMQNIADEHYDLLSQTRLDWTFISPQIIALRNDRLSAGQQFQHFGQAVKPDKINWGLVKGWLQICKHLHHGVNASMRPATKSAAIGPGSNGYPLTLRAIDVDQACIVTLPHSAPYIALSYVWGKDQRIKLKKDSITRLETVNCFLSGENAPSQTIIDAMRATRYLGYRYLWVDALCIIQDDAENIQANVESMQQVYSDAALTIVAAAGLNADYGIPGVSEQCPRTKQQMRVTLNGLTLSNRLESNLQTTYWDTRGWTFQEKILSARLFKLTASQVSYQCDEGCIFEEQYHHSCDGAEKFILYDQNSQLDFETYNVFDVYTIAVSAYTGRSLTNAMDKIKAFDGILHSLEEPLRGPFFYGLPVTTFDTALLWIPVQQCKIGNKQFPSWSWAGWNGQVRYDYAPNSRSLNLLERTAAQCTITLTPSQTRLCTPVVPDTSDLMPDGWTRHFDEEESEIIYQNSDPKLRHYKYPSILRDSRGLVIGGSSSFVLTIEGQVATFRLTAQHSGDPALNPLRGSNCHDGLHYQCRLAVLDGDQHAAGVVVVDSHLVPQLQGMEHRFLAISRSTLDRTSNDITWDTDMKRFRLWTDKTIGEHEVPDNTAYEPYLENFKDWEAELPDDSDPSLPLKSYPVSVDQSHIFHHGGALMNDHTFDCRYYSEMTPWPYINVLLLSEDGNGVVERLGVGRIHVHAFMKQAREETILLG
jgi:hypothetical protein